jgi:rRNA maturation protein Rpf1
MQELFSLSLNEHVVLHKLTEYHWLVPVGLQEELNRGKPNWEHLNDELHVLITVEDTENRATMKMQRAVEEVKKLLVPVVSGFQLIARVRWHPFSA